MTRSPALITLVLVAAIKATAFAPSHSYSMRPTSLALGNHAAFARASFAAALKMSEENSSGESLDSTATASPSDTSLPPPSSPPDPMSEAMREQEEKIRRSEELRAQEVFIKRSTGKHVCTNCGFEYDEAKGISMIGEKIEPGTAFADLPTDWRCPTCRATKDSFEEVFTEIAGFEVNQGYGFGTNSLTAGQKNLLIFGGLGFFFILFLSGYALS